MPPEIMINKDFFKLVLTGQKKLIKMEDLKPINMPSFDELSVKKLYQDALEMPDMKLFFPDSYAKGR